MVFDFAGLDGIWCLIGNDVVEFCTAVSLPTQHVVVVLTLDTHLDDRRVDSRESTRSWGAQWIQYIYSAQAR